MGLNVLVQKYSNATFVRAFCYFAFSRTAYRRFCQNFELPSISTLTRLTSSFNCYENVTFYFKLFLNLNNQQKICILLLNEVYVKPILQYPGKEISGQAINNPSKLAYRVMIVCMFGLPIFYNLDCLPDIQYKLLF